MTLYPVNPALADWEDLYAVLEQMEPADATPDLAEWYRGTPEEVRATVLRKAPDIAILAEIAAYGSGVAVQHLRQNDGELRMLRREVVDLRARNEGLRKSNCWLSAELNKQIGGRTT